MVLKIQSKITSHLDEVAEDTDIPANIVPRRLSMPKVASAAEIVPSVEGGPGLDAGENQQ